MKYISNICSVTESNLEWHTVNNLDALGNHQVIKIRLPVSFVRNSSDSNIYLTYVRLQKISERILTNCFSYALTKILVNTMQFIPLLLLPLEFSTVVLKTLSYLYFLFLSPFLTYRSHRYAVVFSVLSIIFQRNSFF